jgi:hypothetical protein
MKQPRFPHVLVAQGVAARPCTLWSLAGSFWFRQTDNDFHTRLSLVSAVWVLTLKLSVSTSTTASSQQTEWRI